MNHPHSDAPEGSRDDPAEPGSIEHTLFLVRAAQSGDSNAANQLIERYYKRVRRLVALKMGRRLLELEEHDDIVQEAFLRVVRDLKDFEPRTPAGFRNWVASIIENTLRDRWRHLTADKRGGQARREAVYSHSWLSVILVSLDPRPSEAAIGAEAEQRLEEAMLKLNPRHREVIALSHITGMNNAEIAKVMGLGAESSVRALLTVAKAHLSKHL